MIITPDTNYINLKKAIVL